MPRVTAPLLSLTASGSVRRTLTFSNHPISPYAKLKTNPANPRTDAQTLQRLAIAAITKAWQTLTAEQQALWEPLAEQLQLSPYHAYLRFNAHRWNTGDHPTPIPNPYGSATADATNTLCTYANGHYTLTHTVEPPCSIPWMLQAAYDATPTFSPTKANTKILHTPYTYNDEIYTARAHFVSNNPDLHSAARFITTTGVPSAWEFTDDEE